MPWKKIPYADAAKAMKAALEQGANFWNGSIHYGTPEANSLHLLKYYFTKYPEDAEKVVLSIKGAYDGATQTPQGSPDGIRASVEEALRVLDGTKKIDVFEMSRVDPTVPIETSVGTLAELVKEGKIGGVGLSEVSAKTIRRAAAVTKIEAVEIELSLFTTDVLKNGVADTCHELDIALIAYSPVGRGWLTGELRKLEDLPETDYRRHLPRFQAGAFEQNVKLVGAVEEIARRKGVSVAQVALAWVRRQGAIPIPGSTKAERVAENCRDVDLSQQDLAEVQQLLDELPVEGGRYAPQYEALLNQ
ncbi:Pyridoxal reductase [Cytospora mali]|uniref:Pyridoxal reductase n=1 Tax=Cytospora mali TaxID=578113 RepID=A0A194W5Q0_CYTMA|nr:Pyridoxal reductase [Valsa mali]